MLWLSTRSGGIDLTVKVAEDSLGDNHYLHLPSSDLITTLSFGDILVL